jgi:hypothetical protein
VGLAQSYKYSIYIYIVYIYTIYSVYIYTIYSIYIYIYTGRDPDGPLHQYTYVPYWTVLKWPIRHTLVPTHMRQCKYGHIGQYILNGAFFYAVNVGTYACRRFIDKKGGRGKQVKSAREREREG